MTRRTTVLTRLVAGVGGFALATAGLLASTGPANAADIVDNVDMTKTGSLTLHKHEKDATSTPGNPAGDPLEGVEFTIQEVHFDGATFELDTAEGWTAAETLFASAAPTLPSADYTLGAFTDTALTDVTGEANFTGLDAGIYLVTETDSGDNLIQQTAVPFWVSIPMPVAGGFDYDVIAYPKNVLQEFTVTKTVQSPSSVELVPGTTIDWEIETDVPLSPLPYKSLVVSDTLPTNLSFNQWLSVSLNGTALGLNTDYTIDATTSDITFTAAGMAKLNDTEYGNKTVTALLKTNVDAIGAHENSAAITLNGESESDNDVTNWGEVTMRKVSDADPASPLAGATFEVREQTAGATTCTDGTLIGEMTTGADGTASLEFFVGNGTDNSMTICLKETQAPTGFVLPADPFLGPQTLTVTSSSASLAWGDIVNQTPSGPTLPDTGAQGTWAMTVGGFLLIAGAAVTLVIRRRKATH